MAEESLGIKAGRAALWQVAGGGWQTLVRLGASIYLARALKPSDFGLFGMALLYQQLIVTALSMGFGTGLIVKKELTQEDLSTSFWLSCITRTTVFLAVFLSAPLAAMFWKEPRVEPIIRVIAFTLLLQIIGMIPSTLAAKNLEFKKLNIIQAIAILLESSTAIILVAFSHLTYWALVIGMMVNAVFYNLALWLSTGCYLPKFIFHRGAFKYLFRFGINTWIIGVINYLRQNIDYFIVGRLLGTYNLGLYEFAYRIPNLIVERVSAPISSVLFPTIAKVKHNDKEIFYIYCKYFKFVGLLVFPILATLYAVSDIFVLTLWGEKWLPIILPLKILCFVAAIRSIFQINASIFFVKEKPELISKFSIFMLIFSGLSVSLFSYLWGLNGTAFGMLVATFPSFFIMFYIIKFLLKSDIYNLVRSFIPVVIISLICLIGSFFTKKILLINNFSSITILLISSLAGFLAGFSILLTLFNKIFSEIKIYLQSLIKL